MVNFGKKLRECKEAKDFSQAEFAKQLGVYHSIIGKYEKDEVKPTADVIKKIAQVLGATIVFLLAETNEQNVLKDSVMFKRMADIESLPNKVKECLLLTVDNFFKATRLNAL